MFTPLMFTFSFFINCSYALAHHMFKKNFKLRGAQAARAKEAKQLRMRALSLLGEECTDLLDRIWPVSRTCFRGTLSAPAPRGVELILLDNVPLFFSMGTVEPPSPELGAPGCAGTDVRIAPLVPTLFSSSLSCPAARRTPPPVSARDAYGRHRNVPQCNVDGNTQRRESHDSRHNRATIR